MCSPTTKVYNMYFTQRDLNLRQGRRLELLKDYDMSTQFHPGKVNVVADVLSKLYVGSVAHIDEGKKALVKDVHRLARLGVRLGDSNDGGFMFEITQSLLWLLMSR